MEGQKCLPQIDMLELIAQGQSDNTTLFDLHKQNAAGKKNDAMHSGNVTGGES